MPGIIMICKGSKPWFARFVIRVMFTERPYWCMRCIVILAAFCLHIYCLLANKYTKYYRLYHQHLPQLYLSTSILLLMEIYLKKMETKWKKYGHSIVCTNMDWNKTHVVPHSLEHCRLNISRCSFMPYFIMRVSYKKICECNMWP